MLNLAREVQSSPQSMRQGSLILSRLSPSSAKMGFQTLPPCGFGIEKIVPLVLTHRICTTRSVSSASGPSSSPWAHPPGPRPTADGTRLVHDDRHPDHGVVAALRAEDLRQRPSPKPLGGLRRVPVEVETGSTHQAPPEIAHNKGLSKPRGSFTLWIA